MSGIFDLGACGVAVTESSFGGGWAWALNETGALALVEFFEEPAGEIPIESGRPGWIIEPQQAQDLAEHLRSCGVAWEIR